MFLLARRYASAGISCHLSVCVSVCLSDTRWYCIETAARIELIFCIQVCCDLYRIFMEIWVSPKITVLPSETLPQTLDLENFATGHRPTVSAI